METPDEFDPRVGQQLGGCVITGKVADGAMGRVYEARDPMSGRRVAIKVLHPEVAKDRVAVERFKREYETADEFDHPHVVKVLEFGETADGSHFMTMEFLEGAELGDVLTADGPFSLERALRVVSQAASALDYAHSFGVIHRDLKPGNIFLCRSPDGDDVRILDFGSVKLQMETGPKLTAYGTTLGSPYYMSPEQAMGKNDVDQRTDVFALAAILFEILTGKVAFEGASVAEILMKIVNGNPPLASSVAPAVPTAVDSVLSRGMHKDKETRFATTLALATAFGGALGVAGNVEQWSRASIKPLSPAGVAGDGSPGGNSESARDSEPAAGGDSRTSDSPSSAGALSDAGQLGLPVNRISTLIVGVAVGLVVVVGGAVAYLLL